VISHPGTAACYKTEGFNKDFAFIKLARSYVIFEDWAKEMKSLKS
jgi:hypothetical protein